MDHVWRAAYKDVPDSDSEEILVVTGAYGRVPSKEDWDAGKDCKIVNGPYGSMRDIALIKGWGWSKVRMVCINKAGNVVTVHEEAL